MPGTTAFNWPLDQTHDPGTLFSQDNTPISEESFRSVEAEFLLHQDGPTEALNKPTVGGLAWVMYRLLTGDPKWDAATTIEALRGAIKKLYRDHALP
ncbi:MAG TPA: hypothetical protein VJ692_15855 [Nitrospiraceae bacterium]|nr:hypothetical protein [Nitrospiraceae bacterium]